MCKRTEALDVFLLRGCRLDIALREFVAGYYSHSDFLDAKVKDIFHQMKDDAVIDGRHTTKLSIARGRRHVMVELCGGLLLR